MNDSSYWQRRFAGTGLNRRAFLRSAAVTGAGTAAFLAGCRGSTPTKPAAGGGGGASGPATAIFAVPEAKRGGTITTIGGDPTTGWDPYATIGFTTGRVVEPMSIKLIRHDYRKGWKSGNEGAIIGELAEKWESPDPLTYNFTLRKGINWPNQEPMNGRAITAQDVAYSIEKAKLPTAQVQEWVFNNIKSATAIDDYTVQFKLNYPHWRWAMDLDSYNTMIQPKGMYEWAGADGIKDWTKARGGGPWLLEDYKPGSVIRYVPNEAYRKVFGVPYADRVNVAVLAGGAPSVQAFVSKQVDFFAPQAGELETVTKARPDAKVLATQYAPTSTNALFSNTKEKPWDDVRLRRAMSMAVDREGWGKTLRYEFKWESGPITWGYPSWKLAHEKMPADVSKWLKLDVAEAAKLVQAAGVSKDTVFEMHMYPYNNTYTPESQLLIESLGKIGITTKLKVYEYNNWIATAYIGKYSGLLYGPDNLDRVTQQLADRLLANSSRNHSLIQDAETQQLLKDFAAAKGPEDAKGVVDKIQIRSVDQAFAVFRPQSVSPQVWDPAIQNYDGEASILYHGNGYRDAFYWRA